MRSLTICKSCSLICSVPIIEGRAPSAFTVVDPRPAEVSWKETSPSGTAGSGERSSVEAPGFAVGKI